MLKSQVGRQTTPATMHCQCTHLTAFSGSFLVAPNFVDPFADAALFLTFFSNPVVVSCVILIWLVYFTLLTWAKKQDRLDKYRVSGQKWQSVKKLEREGCGKSY